MRDRGYEEYQSEIRLMYFPTIDNETGQTTRLEVVPLKARQFSLFPASNEELHFAEHILNREGAKLNTHFAVTDRGTLLLDL